MQMFNFKLPEIAGDWSSIEVLVHVLGGTRDTVHCREDIHGSVAQFYPNYPYTRHESVWGCV